jgi:hypothetical protein
MWRLIDDGVAHGPPINRETQDGQAAPWRAASIKRLQIFTSLI